MKHPPVALSINAGLGDLLHFEQVLEHDLRVLDYPFAERVVTYDCSTPEGRMSAAGAPDELRDLMARLVDEKVIDRADEVPWGEAGARQLAALGEKYFDDPELPARSRGGTPVYQFLYALDRCPQKYVLHLDADILFHRDGTTSWIREGLDFIAANPDDCIMVSPPAGPPRATRLADLWTGAPPTTGLSDARWHRSGGVSTRYYLADWERLRSLAPWVRGETDALLEESLSLTLGASMPGRWTMNGTDCYAVHIHRRTPGFYRHRDALIRAVESGVYPKLRTGHPWDLRTDRVGLFPWLLAIRVARFKRGLRALVGKRRIVG